MKYSLLFLGLLFASMVFGMLTVPRDEPLRFYLLLANVLVASIILGLIVAQVSSIR